MLTITEGAWQRLAKLRSTRPGTDTMRLTYKGQRVRCHKGIRRRQDRVIEQAGHPTLVLSPELADELSGQTLDASDTERGPRLRIRRISR